MRSPISKSVWLLLGIGAAVFNGVTAAPSVVPEAALIEALVIKGNHFETKQGVPVRFWGVNLVSLYPTHAEADRLAANLRNREINAVRLHHMMRSSLDWNPVSGIPALATYVNDTRTPHPEAWDRFDYLNAQLRAQGIYIMLSLHSSRRFLPGDVDILATDAADRADWMKAMTALGRIPGNLDLFKMLPVIDERCARLMEEFTQRLLIHINPYTGRAYGTDPQVLYIETLNEHSIEYAVIAGNKFKNTAHPDVIYWGKLLQSKWDAFAKEKEVTPCDLYAPTTTAQKLTRGDFLRGLDRAFFNRMQTFMRQIGCRTPMEFSNLWRGEAFQKMEETLSDVIEEHNYCDPLIVRSFDDVFSYFSRSTPIGKPYFVGELNQAEPDKAIVANAPYRTMLPVAASAYGNFNDWSGITWFAWAHGDQKLGPDGWSRKEERRPAVNSDMIGQIESDGMMLDHLRTAGLIFKRGLVASSREPLSWYADEPLAAANYTALMTPKFPFKAGWQNIHAIKRVFGPEPASQLTTPWMMTLPTNPLVSDTGEIRKDVVRGQLTVSAPQAEAFSGKLDAQAPVGLNHIRIGAHSGFATVILVSRDGRPLSTSNHLVISRTYLAGDNSEVTAPVTVLTQLAKPTGGQVWRIKRTRPRGEAKMEVLLMQNGNLHLPTDDWHEADLIYTSDEMSLMP